MGERKSSGASGGIGLFGAVFLVFLVLKLTGTGAVADWSWWWVTSPLWGGAAFVVAVFCLVVALFAIGDWNDHRRAKRGW